MCLFSAVPVVITRLEVSSGPRCLLSGTSVDIQCVNFGLPRPEIVFFRGALQITPGQGIFSNFERVANKFDTIRLTVAQQTDNGQYVCEARDGSRQLNRSLPVDLVFCSKCQVDYPHQLHNRVSLYPGLHHMAMGMRLLNVQITLPPQLLAQCLPFLLHSSPRHSEPASTRHEHRGNEL